MCTHANARKSIVYITVADGHTRLKCMNAGHGWKDFYHCSSSWAVFLGSETSSESWYNHANLSLVDVATALRFDSEHYIVGFIPISSDDQLFAARSTFNTVSRRVQLLSKYYDLPRFRWNFSNGYQSNHEKYCEFLYNIGQWSWLSNDLHLSLGESL